MSDGVRYGGFRCVRCGGATMVVDSRAIDNGVRRRRSCMVCRNRFTTYEIADIAIRTSTLVVGIEGGRPFARLEHPEADEPSPAISCDVDLDDLPTPPPGNA